MSEQNSSLTYEETFSQLIQRTLDSVESVVEFSKEEIPLVMVELLRWHLIESLIFFSLGLIIFLTIGFYYKKILVNKWYPAYLNEKAKTSGEKEFITCGIPTISAIVIFILSLIGVSFIFSSFEWIQILVAPKFYLLEYGASLIKEIKD